MRSAARFSGFWWATIGQALFRYLRDASSCRKTLRHRVGCGGLRRVRRIHVAVGLTTSAGCATKRVRSKDAERLALAPTRAPRLVSITASHTLRAPLAQCPQVQTATHRPPTVLHPSCSPRHRSRLVAATASGGHSVRSRAVLIDPISHGARLRLVTATFFCVVGYLRFCVGAAASTSCPCRTLPGCQPTSRPPPRCGAPRRAAASSRGPPCCAGGGPRTGRRSTSHATSRPWPCG